MGLVTSLVLWGLSYLHFFYSSPPMRGLSAHLESGGLHIYRHRLGGRMWLRPIEEYDLGKHKTIAGRLPEDRDGLGCVGFLDFETDLWPQFDSNRKP